MAFAARGDEAARGQVLAAVEEPAASVEFLQQLLDAPFPVGAGQNQQEVVAADMADEIAARIDAFVQAVRQAQQDLIALGVTIEVVEGFEVVDVHVADHSRFCCSRRVRHCWIGTLPGSRVSGLAWRACWIFISVISLSTSITRARDSGPPG